MRLDAVRLEIDGQLVAHYIYSAKELDALRKGGVQRLYVGNVATGDATRALIDAGADVGGGITAHGGPAIPMISVQPPGCVIRGESGPNP